MTASESTLSGADERATTEVAGVPCLFLLFECDAPQRPAARHSLAGVDELRLGRGPERRVVRRSCAGRAIAQLTIADPRISLEHARLVKDGDGWFVEDLGSKNDTLVNGVRVTRHHLVDGDVVEVGRTFLRFRAAVPICRGDAPDATAESLKPSVPAFATLLPDLAQQFARVIRVAPTDLPVLVRGETGTGKEVVARAIHLRSRRPGDFVAVNCGAVPETLIEAELFGARRGAYSGAVEDRPGLVRAADGGTLFLDEIGDLPLPSQAALLRVLQEREVVAVGAARPVPVDFRLVAATHRDLGDMVARGEFRPDLASRLEGLSVRLPPLRERREDLGILIASLLERAAPERSEALRLAPDVARALIGYRWPFNVRELERALAAAAALTEGDVIRAEHLPDGMLEGRSPAAGSPRPLGPEDAQLRKQLVALLTEHQGSVSAVARAMDRQRVQIHRWVRRLGIDLEEFRGAPERTDRAR